MLEHALDGALDWRLILLASGAAVASVGLGLWILTRLSDPLRWQAARAMRAETGIVVLLAGEEVIDATPRARHLLEGEGGEHARLMHHLSLTFDGAAEAIAGLGELPVERAAESGARFRAERLGDLVRVEIEDARGDGEEARVERAVLRAMEDELATLRVTAEAAPWPTWHLARGGAITWANAAYLDLAELAEGSAGAPPVWPPPALFGEVPLRAVRRMELRLADGTCRAFDCRAAPTPGGTLHFAAPADAAMRAEERLERFTQTLSQTFAQLDVGLAVFDRDRRLVMFNPALVDMTRLPAEFLGGRPALISVLDRLREARVIPEPRDYGAWRARVAAVESGAAGGTFKEMWTLPMGETWRVTGRPHPGGAIAFLLEDVTAQTMLARQFRDEAEIAQAIVDAMEEAVAVFDASGTLTLANSAYADLWQADPRLLLGDVTISDAARRWRDRALPSRSWEELEASVGGSARAPWSGDALLRDGRALRCASVPLARGATMVRFAQGAGKAAGLAVVPEAARGA